MSMRTFGCAACAALLFLVATGAAGAEGQTKEAEQIPERSLSVVAAAGADAGSQTSRSRLQRARSCSW